MKPTKQRIRLTVLILSITGLLVSSSSFKNDGYQNLKRWFFTRVLGDRINSQTLVDYQPISSQYFSQKNCESRHSKPNFLVIGGGGSPKSNEIALEKNILYFQRTLKKMGYNPSSASFFFANGNNGQASIRYLDNQRVEKFKVPNIPNLTGSATLENFDDWLKKSKSNNNKKPIFFYFTGHGILNKRNDNNNALMLWKDTLLTVRQLSQKFDQLPQDSHIVTMMAQCYSGSFANFIYQDGNQKKGVALQTRCGFFATIKTLPSVGCTPEVNEADYQDYSSSFFAGLSGVNRLGNPVKSADYNQDGRISYAEAHAFAKVDEKTTDLPVSTSEVWLQQKLTEVEFDQLVQQPIIRLQSLGRKEQQYVVNSLVKLFRFDPQKSYLENLKSLKTSQLNTDIKQAYQMRLLMELTNIAMEQKIRNQNNSTQLNILERLIQCEASSWN
ncbi:MAG TPA: Caspase domain-containing protein [Cyanothece sp. UBA12306]|nr:Caspase domain-containing protein [Cyanothece sp. UBA12306]